MSQMLPDQKQTKGSQPKNMSYGRLKTSSLLIMIILYLQYSCNTVSFGIFYDFDMNVDMISSVCKMNHEPFALAITGTTTGPCWC